MNRRMSDGFTPWSLTAADASSMSSNRNPPSLGILPKLIDLTGILNQVI
jgi:hypothetical protein